MPYFEINVAKRGFHFFATAPRSIKSVSEAVSRLEVFKQKFPHSEGYTVSMKYCPEISFLLDVHGNIDQQVTNIDFDLIGRGRVDKDF